MFRGFLGQIAGVIGTDQAGKLAARSARLIGLQYLQDTLHLVKVTDGDLKAGVTWLCRMMQGFGDSREVSLGQHEAVVRQTGLRVVKGLPAAERQIFLKPLNEKING